MDELKDSWGEIAPEFFRQATIDTDLMPGMPFLYMEEETPEGNYYLTVQIAGNVIMEVQASYQVPIDGGAAVMIMNEGITLNPVTGEYEATQEKRILYREPQCHWITLSPNTVWEKVVDCLFRRAV